MMRDVDSESVPDDGGGWGEKRRQEREGGYDKLAYRMICYFPFHREFQYSSCQQRVNGQVITPSLLPSPSPSSSSESSSPRNVPFVVSSSGESVSARKWCSLKMLEYYSYLPLFWIPLIMGLSRNENFSHKMMRLDFNLEFLMHFHHISSDATSVNPEQPKMEAMIEERMQRGWK